MNPLSKLWHWIPATYRLIIAAGFVLLVVLLLWFYGAKAWNAIDRWRYNKEVQELKDQRDKLGHDLDQAKTLIHQLQGEYTAEKKRREEIQAEREQLEKVLADQTVTTNAKLTQLKKLLAQPVTPIAPTTSDEELCRRSAALGVPCGP